MKIVNIIGIGLSVALIPLTNYFIEYINASRSHVWFSSETQQGNVISAAEITFQAGIVMGLICGLLIAQCIYNLVNVKTTTTKSISIIGISLLGVAFLWNLLMLSTPTHISFDEGGQIWLLVSLLMTAFSIVFLVQMNRLSSFKSNDEILDDMV